MRVNWKWEEPHGGGNILREQCIQKDLLETLSQNGGAENWLLRKLSVLMRQVTVSSRALSQVLKSQQCSSLHICVTMSLTDED